MPDQASHPAQRRADANLFADPADLGQLGRDPVDPAAPEPDRGGGGRAVARIVRAIDRSGPEKFQPKGAFPYSEIRVAEQLGISREQMREVRAKNLVRDVDWKNGGEVRLTEDAIWMLCRVLLLKLPNLEFCLHEEKKHAPTEQPESQKMTVIPPRPLNPRVIYAIDDDGNKALVWVGNNATFAFNDVIEVVPHETQTGILQCVSPIPRDRRRPHQ